MSAQPAGDEGRAEGVAGAGRVDLLDREGRDRGVAGRVVVAGALGAALDDDRRMPRGQELADRLGFGLRFGQTANSSRRSAGRGRVCAARTQRLPHLRAPPGFPCAGSGRRRPCRRAALTARSPRWTIAAMRGRGQRRAHDMEVVGTRRAAPSAAAVSGDRARWRCAGCCRRSRARRRRGSGRRRCRSARSGWTAMAETSTPSRRSRSMLSRPKSSSPTQPIMPQGWPSFATWSMKMAGAPRGNGPIERDRLEKAVADSVGHDLDQDLAQGDDLLSGCRSTSPFSCVGG